MIAYAFELGITTRLGRKIHAELSPTLRANAGDNQPVVMVLNDQGGASIGVMTDICPTLRDETHGNLPCIVEE